MVSKIQRKHYFEGETNLNSRHFFTLEKKTTVTRQHFLKLHYNVWLSFCILLYGILYDLKIGRIKIGILNSEILKEIIQIYGLSHSFFKDKLLYNLKKSSV